MFVYSLIIMVLILSIFFICGLLTDTVDHGKVAKFIILWYKMFYQPCTDEESKSYKEQIDILWNSFTLEEKEEALNDIKKLLFKEVK